MYKVRLSNGKLRLVGGTKVLMSSFSGGGNSPTTLTLNDYQVSHANIKPIIQRSAGTTNGNVPVLFDFTGSTPSNIEGRIMQGATIIQNWISLANVTINGLSGLGYINTVPQGFGYTVQIRDGLQPANSATISNGTMNFGIGVVFMFAGQSNMVGTLTANYNQTVPGTGSGEYYYFTGGSVNGAIFDTNGWHSPSNGGNGPSGTMGDTTGGGICMFVRLLSTQLAVKYGKIVPVGIIPWAFGSTSIAAFMPAGIRYTSIFGNTGTASPNIGFASPKNIWAGDLEGMCWHQGEADQASSSASYQTSLNSLYQAYLTYVAQFGRSASQFLFAPAVLGNYTPANCPSIENMRAAVANFETTTAQTAARIGWTTIDLDTSFGSGGGLHFVQSADQFKSLKRALQTVYKFTGISTFSGRGPTINTTAARAGDVVTLSIVYDGGTSLAVRTGSGAPTGFYANTLANFSGTTIVPTVALINSNTQVQLTFPGGTSYPVYIKYMGGLIGSSAVDGSGFTASCNPNITNCIYDNSSYPTNATGTDLEPLGLPLQPTVGAITIT